MCSFVRLHAPSMRRHPQAYKALMMDCWAVKPEDRWVEGGGRGKERASGAWEHPSRLAGN